MNSVRCETRRNPESRLVALFEICDKYRVHRTKLMKTAKYQAVSLFDGTEDGCMNRTEEWENWISTITEAALIGDAQRLELSILKTIRTAKRTHPDLGSKLGGLLAQHSVNPGSLRWKDSGPPPADSEQGMSLIRSEDVDEAPTPILPQEIQGRVNQFFIERQQSKRLLSEGFSPPRSLLLVGSPGTGKTMLARNIARQLNLPFMTLDLSTSISSFLGKTGFNLRRILDYARGKQCVLLLDEFDAIAKRRDDTTELGELKRIVNVLLKELEEWPMHSVLVAATNHPDLLDPAIRRRFDVALDLPMPSATDRIAIMERACGRFTTELPQSLLEACARSLDGISGSDIDSLMKAVVRQHLTSDVKIERSLLTEMQVRFEEKVSGKEFGAIVRSFKSICGKRMTVRELATIFGKSVSTIQHHLRSRGSDA